MVFGRAFVGRLSLLLGFGAAACVPDHPGRSWVAGPLAAARCQDAVVASLVEWGASPNFLAGAPAATGAESYRYPTGRVGVWVVVTLRADGEAEIARLEPDATVRRTFSSDCRPADQPSPALVAGVEAPAGVRLTDRVLAAALDAAADQQGLVVYAWSPHMPLSVDGWREIAMAAEELRFAALPILIAHPDADFAAREATRGGIPQHGLRVVSSVELLMRDLQVHAPSIVVFSGERVSPVLPGYRNADGYRKFLDAFLDGS
jgi:hypothetical protein